MDLAYGYLLASEMNELHMTYNLPHGENLDRGEHQQDVI